LIAENVRGVTQPIVFALLLLGLSFSSCLGTRQQEPPPTEPEPVLLPPPPKPAPKPEPPAKPVPAQDVTTGNPLVKVRLFHGAATASVTTSSELLAVAAGKELPLPPGNWRFLRTGMQRPVQQYHVFSKTFRPGEELQRDVYMNEWRGKGYEAQAVLRGDRYAAGGGRILDGRQYWISLARAATQAEAQLIVNRLETQGAWAWVRAETLRPGTGTVSVRNEAGQESASLTLPLTLRCETPVAVKSGERSGKYSGAIELWVEPDGSLGVYETLPMEDYLAGVLPAEMPASWPAGALKAQAVSARSDVLQHLGFKHILEGYHFTNSEGDRVYGGFGGRQASTDAAVAETRGQILMHSGRIVPAVFSSNCGGWTESNENVWSSPPDMALRGVSDLSSAADKGNPSADIGGWLGRRPPAYCGTDEKGYRWTRRYTAAQLDGLVNRFHKVGSVRSIEPGERGVSGRLKSVKITGSQGVATVRKELPIRQVFGDLPSAVLIIKVERGSTGPVAWTFVGGGRGHGVGLCQYGARGMALQGYGHDAILAHYFVGSALETVR